jgi:hypothetical protein
VSLKVSEVKQRGLERDTSLCISPCQLVPTVVLLLLLESMAARLSSGINYDGDFAN